MGDLTSHTYISQRLRLHYVDWGNPDAPPLLLQHGGRDHCRNWDWVARELSADYHVIAPDLRGHGDSQWSPDGNYSLAAHVYDLAQLIHQRNLAPLSIVAHSFGGNIAIRYAGIYPETVSRLAVIEGLGLPPHMAEARAAKPIDRIFSDWIDDQRALSARSPRRYASIEDAFARMQAENPRLSAEQARYLTVHGVTQNEDGSYSWKFDNYVRSISPVDLTEDQKRHLRSRITCPTLLIHGEESWASNPAEDGSLAHFPNARLSMYEQAGHWVQHDQQQRFVREIRDFLKP